ncbi:TrkA-N domain-containing protein [Halosimplex carlsbadense 2-9-1]|uniref:TrkA-N domain-containing protein n=1 Tax=Halosimplex carlsbadense 2-9-1 TaxID=797114 RepID=M0CR26_9EURY|nr:NAD(P)-binding protein [Halosimplex carlsbadense]ELZ25073.1 TrkA-N domain-containing protein [Halosimplex carlsbadense 2-9-1]
MAGEYVRALIGRPLARRVGRPVAAFAALVVGGVVGFGALAGVGAVEALFWLLDPTSIEIFIESHDAPARSMRAFTIVVESGLILSGLWIGETVISATFGGQIETELRQMQVERTIDGTEQHVVVCGYGTFGKTIARRLRDRDRPVVVVETGDGQYERALDDGLLAVQGDARREELLVEAGAERADAVVGAVDDANVNIQVAITTGELAPDARVVVRAGDEMYESVARRAGADEVIVPEVVSGEQVTTTL